MAVRLGVVVPVRLLDDAAFGIFATNARAAPGLEFIAVGDLAQAQRDMPENLKFIGAQCGLYEAMNLGLAAASADYLLFMGLDDRLIVQNVPRAVEQLGGVPRAPLLALPYVYGARQYRLKPRGAAPCAYHHQGVLFDRITAMRLGGYDPQYRLHADLDLMFRMQQAGPAGWIDVALVEFRSGGMTTTGERSLESIREINRIYKAHGVSRVDRMYFFSMLNLSWFWLRRRLPG